MPTCPACRHTWKPTRRRPAYVGDISCSCGARWRGKYALDNEIIQTHRDRGHRLTVWIEPHVVTMTMAELEAEEKRRAAEAPIVSLDDVLTVDQARDRLGEIDRIHGVDE